MQTKCKKKFRWYRPQKSLAENAKCASWLRESPLDRLVLGQWRARRPCWSSTFCWTARTVPTVRFSVLRPTFRNGNSACLATPKRRSATVRSRRPGGSRTAATRRWARSPRPPRFCASSMSRFVRTRLLGFCCRSEISTFCFYCRSEISTSGSTIFFLFTDKYVIYLLLLSS